MAKTLKLRSTKNATEPAAAFREEADAASNGEEAGPAGAPRTDGAAATLSASHNSTHVSAEKDDNDADDSYDLDAWYKPEVSAASSRAKKRERQDRDTEISEKDAELHETENSGKKKPKSRKRDAESAGAVLKDDLKKAKRLRKAERALKRKRGGQNADDDVNDLLGDAAEPPFDDTLNLDGASESASSETPVDDNGGGTTTAPMKKKKVKNSVENGSKKAGKCQQKRMPHGVWIGNLSFATTEATLRKFFENCGEVARVNLPLSDLGRKLNKGFAYVDFATEEARDAAIKLSERELEGRNVLIKDAKNFHRRPSPNETSTSSAPVGRKRAGGVLEKRKLSTTLFVGNLPFGTTEDSIRECFSNCEGLRKVRMPTFEDSGNCKGFAYLDFDTDEHSRDALARHPKPYLNRRLLRLEFAGEEATRKGMPWKKRIEAVAANTAAVSDGTRTERNDNGGVTKGGSRNAWPAAKTERLKRKKECTKSAAAGMDSFKDRPLGIPDPRKKKQPGDDIAQKPASAAVVPFTGTKIVFTDDD